jgi:hypothetical protein
MGLSITQFFQSSNRFCPRFFTLSWFLKKCLRQSITGSCAFDKCIAKMAKRKMINLFIISFYYSPDLIRIAYQPHPPSPSPKERERYFNTLLIFTSTTSANPKKEGCVLVAFSFGEGRDEASILLFF